MPRQSGKTHHNYKHGLADEKGYTRWTMMKGRCYTPTNAKYDRYGWRGIGVCKRWRESYKSFKNDMGQPPSKAHSIERIDNDWHYEPSNCIWATPKEQSANTRRNLMFTYNGKTQHLAEWCRELNIRYSTLYSRLFRSLMPFNKAVNFGEKSNEYRKQK